MARHCYHLRDAHTVINLTCRGGGDVTSPATGTTGRQRSSLLLHSTSRHQKTASQLLISQLLAPSFCFSLLSFFLHVVRCKCFWAREGGALAGMRIRVGGCLSRAFEQLFSASVSPSDVETPIQFTARKEEKECIQNF